MNRPTQWSRKRILRIALILAALVIAIHATRLLLYGPSLGAWRAAWQEYAAARPEGIDRNSPAFALFGLRGGETLQQVDHLLSAADERLSVTAIEPPWDGRVVMYRFTYGPETSGLVGPVLHVVEEDLLAFFDPQERVSKIQRVVRIHGLLRNDVQLEEYHQSPSQSPPTGTRPHGQDSAGSIPYLHD